ncbi:MAG: penicillin-binding protein activator [Caulobacterales bacterium]
MRVMGSNTSSTRNGAAPSANAVNKQQRPWPLLGAIAAASILAACATTPAGPSGPGQPDAQGPTGPQTPEPPRTRAGLTPPFMANRDVVRVGILLPFSSRPDEAAALYNAAELALFQEGNQNMLLIPRDSGGGEPEAEAAARTLIADGVDVIIGPVTRDGVAAAGGVARRERIPLIGLSSDRTVAAEGVYLLSFQLEDEVARIVDFAVQRGIRSFAVMAPDNEYGRRVSEALRAETARRGAVVAGEQVYPRDIGQATAAAERLAQQTQGAGVQAVLIADSGSVLRAAAAGLSRVGLGQPNVRLLGTSVWAGADLRTEAPLAGGWYVAPDPTVRSGFEQAYRTRYGTDATRLASLAFDAVSLAALLSNDAGPSGLSRREIERQEGFLGSDGVFRFRNTGTIERGWAVMEVRARAAPTPIAPAPREFTRPAS